MIGDWERQVAELTQRLEAQNLERDCEMDDRDSESNFENRITILFWVGNSVFGIGNMET